MLDAWLPGGTEGPVCAIRPLLLEHLELLQEQGGGEEPDRAHVTTVFDREACRGQPRLRPAGVRQTDDPEDLGRRKPAEGYALSLSKPVQAPDPVDCRGTRAAEDRPADLYAGRSNQDVPEILPGRIDGKDAGLGRRRVRRLYEELTT